MMRFTHNNQKGYMTYMTLFVMIITLGIAMNMSVLIVWRQKSSTDAVNSIQSYYAAEAGMEDALLRLKNSPQMSSLTYSLVVGGATAQVVIPNIIGGSRIITSQGDNNGIVKNIQVVYSAKNYGTSFYYGIEAGQGGLQMNNGSEIHGNVFSNGNISGPGTIDNNVVVAGNGNSISVSVYVNGDALVYSCLYAANVGNLTYVTGGNITTCIVRGSTSSQSQEISQQPLPIAQSQIDAWKNGATSGEVFSGDKTISSSQSLGPIKITGNLILDNNVTLTITGTVYVVGDIVFGNSVSVKLDSSYDNTGGVLLSDGTISTGNSATLMGSGQTGSYLLLLSTSSSSSAIDINNNATGGIFYTTSGVITVHNNTNPIEVAGYKVIMLNGSSIQYSSGVVNIFFSNGPGGGSWRVSNWQER